MAGGYTYKIKPLTPDGSERVLLQCYDDGRVREVSFFQDVYRAWLAAGNTPEVLEYVTPPPAPPIPREQRLRIALAERGFGVEEIVDILVYERRNNNKEGWQALAAALDEVLAADPPTPDDEGDMIRRVPALPEDAVIGDVAANHTSNTMIGALTEAVVYILTNGQQGTTAHIEALLPEIAATKNKHGI